MYTVIFKDGIYPDVKLAKFADPLDALKYCDEKTETGKVEQEWNDESLMIRIPGKKDRYIMPYSMNAVIVLQPKVAWESVIKSIAFEFD